MEVRRLKGGNDAHAERTATGKVWNNKGCLVNSFLGPFLSSCVAILWSVKWLKCVVFFLNQLAN